jgi:hypothetical protein
MTTITWTEEGKAPETYELSDALLASLEAYRLAAGFRQQDASGQWVTIPRDASVRDMFIRIAREHLLDKVLADFPTPELAEAQEQARAAQQAVEDAKAAVFAALVASREEPKEPARTE